MYRNRADIINGEKERLLGNVSPHRQKTVQLPTTDSDHESVEHLKLHSYAHVSSSLHDVQKKGKRAVHPTT